MGGTEPGTHELIYSGTSLSVLCTFPLVQDSSHSVFLTFGARKFFVVRTVWCVIDCRAASLLCTHEMPLATLVPQIVTIKYIPRYCQVYRLVGEAKLPLLKPLSGLSIS